ncbi:MAG: GTPase ObgE [Phycisphaeraceae bacterium]|nr:GTPase ObgE [Phycisphaeraceae bacterium]MCW5762632.1 GTPase ObgE [Phycisphaeraceae bacterium]
MFVDQVVIEVRAGKGGDGCLSFHRGPHLPKGGPDGGDGGRGGDILFYADEGLNTLVDFKGRRHWVAENGEQGRGKQQFGASGKDREIRVPPGTMVFNDQTGELIHDLKAGERVVIARGGRGGFGNEHFKSSINRTPRQFTPGEPGEEFTLRLELKLLADVGIVGLPNAGKSTLLRSLTRATPKVANYPFTTLTPQLGIAMLDDERRIVLADIPGLIEGAADGAGLGHDFLRHVDRTRAIVHLIDALPEQGTPVDNYLLIRSELEQYSPELAEKPEVIAINKADLFPDRPELDEIVREFRRVLRLGADVQVVVVSGASNTGLRELLELLWTMLRGRGKAVAGWVSESSGEGPRASE